MNYKVGQKVRVKDMPMDKYLGYPFNKSGYDFIPGMAAFRGKIFTVKDIYKYHLTFKELGSSWYFDFDWLEKAERVSITVGDLV